MNTHSNSEIIKNECCGNMLDTCDKHVLAERVKQLEIHNLELQKEIDEYNRLRKNKEAFAKQCFLAGRDSVTDDCTSERAWLQYRAEKLI